MRAGRAWVAALLLLGCKPSGAEDYQRARARYEALVLERRPLADPAFDQVLRGLEAVPQGSPSRGEAERLRSAIVRGRAGRVGLPMATEPAAGEEPADVLEQKAECAALSRALGDAGLSRSELERRLSACRRSLIELEEAHHPARP